MSHGGPMDDQTPAPQQHSYFTPPPGLFPEPSPRPRRHCRVLAIVTATALVSGLGGVGAGYAIGHGLSDGASSSSSNASCQSNVSTNGSRCTPSIHGNGGWSWSNGGQGGLSVPTDPYTDPNSDPNT